jgi:flagellar biosynthetic protein FliP
VIVLSFVRRSLSVNELPPNPVIIGLALFLTAFVMGPVAGRMYDRGYAPYKAGTRESELSLFQEIAARSSVPADVAEAPAGEPEPELSFRVVVPAFVLSELKTAFQMGFLLFLPFLVIDLVVSSVLLSMGMFMLPPVMISTPFKILLFVLVDGWHLVCESLITSFVVA